MQLNKDQKVILADVITSLQAAAATIQEGIKNYNLALRDAYELREDVVDELQEEIDASEEDEDTSGHDSAREEWEACDLDPISIDDLSHADDLQELPEGA